MPVKRALLAALLLATCAASGTSPPPIPQLNILWIVSDDHSADVFGAYGTKPSPTPNLDRLCADGIRFDRAYCNAPVCSASRQSFLTGTYPHASGVTLLRTPLAEEKLTLADHLRAHGYRTAAVGKMHFNTRNIDHGFDLIVGRGDHNRHLKANPPRKPPEGQKVRPRWRPFRVHARTWLNSDGFPEGRYEKDTAAVYYVKRAVDFIRQDPSKPFFVMLSFNEPHSPFNFPIEAQGTFKPEDMKVPKLGPEDRPQIPKVFADLTDAEKRGIAAAYWNSTAFMDARVGEALAALRAMGLAKNTVVAYLGDHGYHLGHHGRFEKHSFYERAVRAPLVFSSPAHLPKGKVVAGLAEFVDVFPTLCEFAHAPVPKGLHGRSLMGLLRGEGPGRPSAFSSYGANEEAMIRTEEWKLIFATGRMADDMGYTPLEPPTGRTLRLYHVKRDPEEMRDVAKDNPDVVKRLEGLLHDRLRETWPADLKVPAGLPRREAIDWMLAPVERRRKG